MNDRQERELFFILQLAGGTFPAGGFSQSWGLETYVSQGRMKTEEAFKAFLEAYLMRVIVGSEGPILCRCYDLTAAGAEEEFSETDELLTAMKLTKESREASLRMGKAFLRIISSVLQDESIDELYQRCQVQGINYVTAYGAVCAKLGLDKRAVLAGYVYSTVNAIVQSAVKLIPLGNIQAQKILTEVQEQMSQAVESSLKLPFTEVSNFCPGFDLAGILHETLPVRLYMS